MMFTFYNTSDGRVLFVSDLQSEDNAKNIASVTEGSAYVFGDYPPHLYVFKNGEPVAKSEADLAQQEINAAWGRLRSLRDQILQSCDWTQVPDAPVDQAAWAAYRQALRDLPGNTVDPENPNWPQPPGS